ncbi:MAG: hypothetical protein ACRD99_06050, partial [Nitrososphaera sp.]
PKSSGLGVELPLAFRFELTMIQILLKDFKNHEVATTGSALRILFFEGHRYWQQLTLGKTLAIN